MQSDEMKSLQGKLKESNQEIARLKSELSKAYL